LTNSVISVSNLPHQMLFCEKIKILLMSIDDHHVCHTVNIIRSQALTWIINWKNNDVSLIFLDHCYKHVSFYCSPPINEVFKSTRTKVTAWHMTNRMSIFSMGFLVRTQHSISLLCRCRGGVCFLASRSYLDPRRGILILLLSSFFELVKNRNTDNCLFKSQIT
jgi:hypothetical protein